MADRVVVGGRASGEVVLLTEALSFWGGVDSTTGWVIDAQHPQHGAELTGRIVVMPGGRGSSSASSVIAECARVGSAPAALIVGRADEILSTGAIVADELYGRPVPILEVDDATYEACAAAARIEIGSAGELRLS